MESLLRWAMVLMLLANAVMLGAMALWAARVVAQLASSRAAVHHLREALAGAESRIEAAIGRSEARLQAAVADSQAAIERAIEELVAARTATNRAIQRLDWTTDHLLDTAYPPDELDQPSDR